MSRYEKADENVNKLLNEIISEDFTSISGCNIHVITDSKKRMKNGKIVLAEIKKPSAIMKYLYGNVNGELDYIIIIDEFIQTMSDYDIKKVLFHELCHTEVDIDSNDPYKLRDHEITTFYEEIKKNEDDPKCMERISESLLSMRESNN